MKWRELLPGDVIVYWENDSPEMRSGLVVTRTSRVESSFAVLTFHGVINNNFIAYDSDIHFWSVVRDGKVICNEME